MVKFVWIDVPGGGRVPVNPDRVAYLRKAVSGATGVVFGAFAGGLHQVEVSGDFAEVVAQLEGASPVSKPPTPPPGASRSPKRKGGTSPP